jgi:hypothetical protein
MILKSFCLLGSSPQREHQRGLGWRLRWRIHDLMVEKDQVAVCWLGLGLKVCETHQWRSGDKGLKGIVGEIGGGWSH